MNCVRQSLSQGHCLSKQLILTQRADNCQVLAHAHRRGTYFRGLWKIWKLSGAAPHFPTHKGRQSICHNEWTEEKSEAWKCRDLPPHLSFSPSSSPFNTMRHERSAQSSQSLFATNSMFARQPWLAVSCAAFHDVVDSLGFCRLTLSRAFSSSWFHFLTFVCFFVCSLVSRSCSFSRP